MQQLVHATVGIVVAAGSGVRLGLRRPKAFVPVRGVTMARRSVLLLRASGVVSSIVVVIPSGGESGEVCYDADTDGGFPDCAIVPGGATRQRSVQHALRYCREELPGVTYVVIHDAARCLTPPTVVRRVVEAAWRHGAATAGVPAVDTLRRVGPDKTICGELDRSTIWQIQTPQAFRLDLIWDGHQRAPLDVTDDTSLVTPFHPVSVVEGSRLGFKITTPEDLAFAEAIAD